ncbi:hypothetical protein F5877DRAFT_28274, partial [Lentinula edodes]
HEQTGEWFWIKAGWSISSACPCGARTQTRDHIIQTCEIYDNYRNLLWDVS